jgi:hypothetical protein
MINCSVSSYSLVYLFQQQCKISRSESESYGYQWQSRHVAVKQQPLPGDDRVAMYQDRETRGKPAQLAIGSTRPIGKAEQRRL